MLRQRTNTSRYEAGPKSTHVPKTFPQDQCVDPNLVSLHVLRLAGEWGGRWESSTRLKLGKLGYYHYTTPAPATILVAFAGIRQIDPAHEGKAPRRGAFP